jgi:hypothetical protein
VTLPCYCEFYYAVSLSQTSASGVSSFMNLARGQRVQRVQRVHAKMSGDRYNYIRVPTAYNNFGFEANDLVDYGDYKGSLQRSLSGFSDDTASLGSPTRYEASPGADNFNYNFDLTYPSRPLPAPRPGTSTTGAASTAQWTDTTSPRQKSTYTSQPAATSPLSIQPSR